MYRTQKTTKAQVTSINDFYGEAAKQIAQGRWTVNGETFPLHWVANELAAQTKKAELEAKNPEGDMLWL